MSYQHILVPVDGSEVALNVVQHAVDLAKAFNSNITVVQVMTLDPYIAAEYLSDGQSNLLIERARKFIEDNLAQAKAKFNEYGVDVETKILEGESIHRTIMKSIDELNIDLIVISSHGRSGFKKLIMGSVAQSLITEVNVPVFVVKQ
ncbi:universal stress protein [Acinetobacter sp. DSM 11652]|uniref:universal stress protein n=1 Tax=Acinetobacter sp. DSM 11652 TaxID=346222 RepID=UPI0008B29B50|nr:universal stress protein [Acinetobacter sp. DSM 11652]SEL18858.1 Nucleotide-binding universal stress protein, UspA family [Acinetobacter sp. DSM 11652]